MVNIREEECVFNKNKDIFSIEEEIKYIFSIFMLIFYIALGSSIFSAGGVGSFWCCGKEIIKIGHQKDNFLTFRCFFSFKFSEWNPKILTRKSIYPCILVFGPIEMFTGDLRKTVLLFFGLTILTAITIITTSWFDPIKLRAWKEDWV